MSSKRMTMMRRTLAGLLSLTMTASMTSVLPASAEDISASKYPYAIFAGDEQGGITLALDSFTLNGSGFTNGDYSTTAQYPNINGNISDHDDIDAEEAVTDGEDNDKHFNVSKDMIYIHNKLMNSWFAENCQTYDESYSLSEMNINLNTPVYVTGRLSYEGNVSLDTAVGAVSDVTLSGGNLNGHNAVIYSKFGDIKITDSQASMNGLIYAPFGTVTIDCDYFNMDGLIIAQNVVVNSCGANINYSNSWAEFVGTNTEELSWSYDDWQYLADTDEDGLPNLIEKEIGTKPSKSDSDGDLLPDGYEMLTLGTDPLKVDTDDNGISDYDEDFDEDGLSNGREYELGTQPYNDDTDGDNLTDGDEINTYSTNPLKVDTDEDGLNDDDEIYFGTDPNDSDSDDNGILDDAEKRSQTFTYKVENEDCAVTEVIISMEGTGNLQKTTTVESVMKRDMLCTDVVGLVGEPFSIETTSEFDNATLTFVIDKDKLGDTEFDNLLFLWYNETTDEFVELDTVLDKVNSNVSINTTHFSRYMVVDSEKWFEAWAEDIYHLNHIPGEPNYTFDTIIAIDCSGSMDSQDNDGSKRTTALEQFISYKEPDDRIGIVLFDNSVKTKINLTEVITTLPDIYNSGGTNFYNALKDSFDSFDDFTKPSASLIHTNRIILLSDGYDSNYTKTLNFLKEIYSDSENKYNGIAISTIGLGDYSDDSILAEIANLSGGEFYKIKTSDDLLDTFINIGLKDSFDITDSDADGLFDYIEAAGIRIQNGRILHTCQINNRDSDGDGLIDGEEVLYVPIKYGKTQFYDDGTVRQIEGYSFKMISNPGLVNSDGDIYNDYDEIKKYSSNPLVDEVLIYKLSDQDYLRIVDTDIRNPSFGGSQMWFSDDNCITEDYVLHKYGCGLIAISDFLLYESKCNAKYNNIYTNVIYHSDGSIDKNDYLRYIRLMNAFNFPTFRFLGLDGISMQQRFNTFSSSQEYNLKARWSVPENYILSDMKEMLNNDFPVILSIGPSSKSGLIFYEAKDPSKKLIELSSLTADKYNGGDVVDDHYVVVTKIIDNRVTHQVILEISSWGKKYYIDFNKYLDFVNSFSNYTFSNILYIYEP